MTEAASRNARPILEVEELIVEFRVSARQWGPGGQKIRAVDDVSFHIERDETLALVGESGCGKTTVGRAIVGLYQPEAGVIRFDGATLTEMSRQERHNTRRRIQMIFQDPYASLNPRMTVEEIIAEPLRAHRIGPTAERRRRVRELLKLVGLDAEMAIRFPGAFSGGQRQRIGIARSLALEPALIIADEPVSSLDVSMQAQIINLLEDLQERLGLSMLLIAHDIAVVQHTADRVAVMYLGRLVEVGEVDDVLGSPVHPYTRALISAVPVPDPELAKESKAIFLTGEVPSPVAIPSGCRFHTRCPVAIDICKTLDPEMKESDGRAVACHLVNPPNTAAGGT